VHVRLGEPAPAVPLVQAVFERCASDGWIGPALLVGPQTLALLLDGVGPRLPQPTAVGLRSWLQVARELRQQAEAVAAPAAPAKPRQTAADVAALQGLSNREREVLTRIAAGDSNKLIARAFDLSPHTVKRHVANILDKLGLASRGQAAAWWRDRAAA
jgi:LuxR family maltose regulon positive regulatory protein